MFLEVGLPEFCGFYGSLQVATKRLNTVQDFASFMRGFRRVRGVTYEQAADFLERFGVSYGLVSEPYKNYFVNDACITVHALPRAEGSSRLERAVLLRDGTTLSRAELGLDAFLLNRSTSRIRTRKGDFYYAHMRKTNALLPDPFFKRVGNYWVARLCVMYGVRP